MIHSMTAFARAEVTATELSVCIEIRSYNSKYLDISLRMPQGYASMEERVKKLISNFVARGRIEIHIKLTDTSEKAVGFEVDAAKASAYYEALKDLKHALGFSEQNPLDLVAGVPGVIKTVDKQIDLDLDWEAISDCFTAAMTDLVAMRQREGAFLEEDFTFRLNTIEDRLADIESTAAGLTHAYQERLSARISDLTQGQVPLDPARLAQEAAFLADKSDISEEIVRAKSHILQFRNILSADDPAGRKINFLLQEFNREFNTMGSKVGSAEASHLIVEVKSELEKMREQAQNVE